MLCTEVEKVLEPSNVVPRKSLTSQKIFLYSQLLSIDELIMVKPLLSTYSQISTPWLILSCTSDCQRILLFQEKRYFRNKQKLFFSSMNYLNLSKC